MKTKEQVYVKINNAKEAKDAKRILKALGENIRENYFNNNGEAILWCFKNEWVITYSHGEETEVSLKELIQIIANEKTKTEDKPKSILDGKVAIQVNNEREFKLLMEHFESKGWILHNSRKPTNQEFSSKCWASYKNRSDFKYVEKYIDITVIPFSDFAKEVGIEVPKFIMKSEDGVDLYEGDVVHVSDLVKNDNRYDYLGEYKLEKKDFNYTKQKSPEWYVFHSKENALKWVEEQNKPKEIEVPLYFMNQTATVTANCEVHINGTRGITYAKLSHGDIADIQNAINKLK